MIVSPAPPYHASTARADESVRVVMEAIDTLPIGDRLLALRSIAGLVGSRRAGTVLAARTAGMSWAEIADRLGTSRQAVWKRFGPEEVDPPSPRTYSSCASYKAVTTRPPLEIAS
jgi:DNA-directed RNA polymerase specialized sigma24 family protein